MPNFHHHPDGLIFVRTKSGIYKDTVDNFRLDLGQSYAATTVVERFYEPGKRHVLNGRPQALAWAEGDGYIGAIAALLSARAQRVKPALVPLATVRQEKIIALEAAIIQAAQQITGEPSITAYTIGEWQEKDATYQRWVSDGKPAPAVGNDYAIMLAEASAYIADSGSGIDSASDLLERWGTNAGAWKAISLGVLAAYRKNKKVFIAKGNRATVTALTVEGMTAEILALVR